MTDPAPESSDETAKDDPPDEKPPKPVAKPPTNTLAGNSDANMGVQYRRPEKQRGRRGW